MKLTLIALAAATTTMIASQATIHAKPGPVPPSATLQRATSLYQAGDYATALVELERVVDGETKDSVANQQRAQFFTGKALHRLGYHSASLAHFGRIVDQGPAHRYYAVTLPWLARLAGDVDEASGVLHRIGAYGADDFQAPVVQDVRDQLFYLRGLHAYRKGSLDAALALLAAVDASSPFFLKARYLTGVIHARNYKGRAAVAAFKALLVIGKTRPAHYPAKDITAFDEMARLQLARLFYSALQFGLALTYYGQISPTSASYPAALRESAWAHWWGGSDAVGVANLHRLDAPYLNQPFNPEVPVLEAVFYHRRCLHDSALKAVARLDARYKPLKDELKALLRKFEDNAELFAYAKRLKKAPQPSAIERLVLDALSEGAVVSALGWADKVDRELERLAAAPKPWQNTVVASELLEELTLQQALARADAGKLVRRRLEQRHDQLRDYLRDGIKIKIESLEAKERGTAKTETGGPWQPASMPTQGGEASVAIGGDRLLWTFNRGFAKNRQGNYRFALNAGCPQAAKKHASKRAAMPAAPSKHYDFSNDDLEVELVHPNERPVYAQKLVGRSTLTRFHREFLPEILATVDDLRARGLL